MVNTKEDNDNRNSLEHFMKTYFINLFETLNAKKDRTIKLGETFFLIEKDQNLN